MKIKLLNEANFLINDTILERFLYGTKKDFALNLTKAEDKENEEVLIKSINTIRKYCFKNVSTIENITINTNLSLQIEQFAFENCSKLKTIVLDVKDKDLTIQSDAFKSCNELDCVHIKSTSKITIEKDSFSQCYNLRVLILDSDNVEIRKNAFESSNDLCIVSKNNDVVKEYCNTNNFEYKEL